MHKLWSIGGKKGDWELHYTKVIRRTPIINSWSKKGQGVTIENGLIITNYNLYVDKKATGSHSRKRFHYNQL